ncbi:MAG: hypothetical protein JSS32_09110 [Verrucomicrobia bacterium]|nr:hypothetical protein [Verrucomicrobiota bacterium]
MESVNKITLLEAAEVEKTEQVSRKNKETADAAIQGAYVATAAQGVHNLLAASHRTVEPVAAAHKARSNRTPSSSTTNSAAAVHRAAPKRTHGASSSNNNPWPTVQWPDDGDPTDPAFNEYNPDIFNPDGSLRSNVDVYGQHGLLQDLFGMIDSLKNYSSNAGTLLPQLIMMIAGIASNDQLSSNPDIQAILGNGFIQGGSGGQQSFSAMMIDWMGELAWGNVLANGGTIDQANAASTKFLIQLRNQFAALGLDSSDPIAGAMVQRVNELLAPAPGGGTVLNQDNQRAFINTNGQPDPTKPNYNPYYGQFGNHTDGENSDQWFYCMPNDADHSYGHGAAGWAQVINGMVGQFLFGEPGVEGGESNIGDISDSVFYMQFDELIKKIKDPGLLLILLFILLGMGKDDSYQTQLGGFGMSTDFLSNQTTNVSSIISEFSASNFSTGTTATSGTYFIHQLMDILSNTSNKSSYTDNSFYKTVADTINGILNTNIDTTKFSPPPSPPLPDSVTLRGLYDQGDDKDIAFVLNQLGSNFAANNSDFLDKFNTLSKTMTDRSQTIGTQTSGVTQKDNQVVNVMNTGLNDTTSGFVAQESTAVKNQITT